MDANAREDMINWLTLSNDVILKSERYEGLINDVCMYFYKESVNNINEDTLAFVRRSANELLRNKASKEALRKKLIQASQDSQSIIGAGIQDSSIPVNEIMVQRANYGGEVNTVDPTQLQYILPSPVAPSMMNVST